MLEQVINNNGNRKSGLYKYLVQAFDRTYFRLCPNRIRADHKPHTYDFSSLTREEYLEDPELFYKKPDEIPEFLLTKKSDVGNVEIFDVKFPSPVQTVHEENNVAYGYFYKNKTKKSTLSLIIIHGWRRSFLYSEKKIALRLAKINIDCFILKLPFHIERTPKGALSGEYALTGDVYRTVDSTRQLIIEVRTVKSWLQRETEKIAIMGISLGGMMAHLAMAVEEFDAGISIAGGGNNAGIIWEGIATQEVKENIIKADITREQVNHIFQMIDPSVLARHNKTKNTLMMNGIYDEVIPIKFTVELWEALGRPKIKWYPCAHVNIVFIMKRVVSDMIQFIRETV